MIRLRTICAAASLAACQATAPAPAAHVAAPPPAAVAEPPSAPGYVSLAAGVQFACGLRSDGTVRCWGSDEYGTLGDGGAREGGARPREVRGLSGVTRLAAAGETACAIARPGRLLCWGARVNTATSRTPAARRESSRSEPEALSDLEDFVDVAWSGVALCAVRRGGTVRCWGSTGAPAAADDAPSERPSITDATAIASSAGTFCVATRAGPVRCWNRSREASIPFPVGAVRALMGGGCGIYARFADNTARRIEDGVIPAISNGPSEVRDVHALASAWNGCIALSEGRVRVWSSYGMTQGHGVTLFGGDSRDPARFPVAGLRGALSLAMGEAFACALTDPETVRCWGENTQGELGEPSNVTRHVPAGLAPLTGVRDLVTYERGVCALMTTSGPARCWGLREGEPWVADEVREGTALPVERRALGPAAALGGWGYVGCAVSPDGRVTCARIQDYNRESEREELVDVVPLSGPAATVVVTHRAVYVSLRDGTVVGHTGGLLNEPRQEALAFAPVAGLSGVSRLMAMGDVACALSDAGPPRCWGDDTEWGLVARSTETHHAQPVAREGLGSVTSLAAGEGHACAVERDGAVRCWGHGRAGQLGVGPGHERAMPVEVPGARGAVEVAVGSQHSCARMGDGAVRCWGANDHGQLGDGTTAGHGTPAPVADLERASRIVAARDHTCALRDDGTVWCWGAGADGVNGDGTDDDQLRPAQVRYE